MLHADREVAVVGRHGVGEVAAVGHQLGDAVGLARDVLRHLDVRVFAQGLREHFEVLLQTLFF